MQKVVQPQSSQEREQNSDDEYKIVQQQQLQQYDDQEYEQQGYGQHADGAEDDEERNNFQQQQQPHLQPKEVKILETSDDIQERQEQVLGRYSAFKTEAKLKREKLEDSRRFQYFKRIRDELESWIYEELQAVSDETFKDATNLQAKIQEPQAFKDEMDAPSNAIVSLNNTRQEMIHLMYNAPEVVRKRLEELHRLCQLMQARLAESLKLQQALVLVQFLRSGDEVLLWISDKETFVTPDEFGTELEHVDVLQRKFDEFGKDMASQEYRVSDVNIQSEKLANDGHLERDTIVRRREDLNQEWQQLKQWAGRRQELFGAHEIQRFNRDKDEAIAWIFGKDVILSSDEYGRRLASIQALQRKNEGVERDLSALEERVITEGAKADRICGIHGDHGIQIRQKYEDFVHTWEMLVEKAKSCKSKLDDDDSYLLHRFLSEYRDLINWINDMKCIISANELAKDVKVAATLLKRHQDSMGDIDAREDSFKLMIDSGNLRLEKEQFCWSAVGEKLSNLTDEIISLLNLWEDRRILYEQRVDLQLFFRDSSIDSHHKNIKSLDELALKLIEGQDYAVVNTHQSHEGEDADEYWIFDIDEYELLPVKRINRLEDRQLCVNRININRVRMYRGKLYFFEMKKKDLNMESKPFQRTYKQTLELYKEKQRLGATDKYDHRKYKQRLFEESKQCHTCSYCGKNIGHLREKVYIHFRYDCPNLFASANEKLVVQRPMRFQLDRKGLYMWQAMDYVTWMKKQEFVKSQPRIIIAPLDYALIWTNCVNKQFRRTDGTDYDTIHEHGDWEKMITPMVKAGEVDAILLFVSFYSKRATDSVNAEGKYVPFRHYNQLPQIKGTEHAGLLVIQRGRNGKFEGYFHDSQTHTKAYSNLVAKKSVLSKLAKLVGQQFYLRLTIEAPYVNEAQNGCAMAALSLMTSYYKHGNVVHPSSTAEVRGIKHRIQRKYKKPHSTITY